jgi:hypothetical protein
MLAGSEGGSKSSGRHEGLSFLFRDQWISEAYYHKGCKGFRKVREEEPCKLLPKMEIEDESTMGVILDAVRRFSERNV